MNTTKIRRGDCVRCSCDALVGVAWDEDGPYIDCPECGNFGYII